ncbi:MAG: helix-turn-helix domain-containing protein [Sediminibacterium sp.]|jgi:excisionase family DNA binding protein
MKTLEPIRKPSKSEQRIAAESYETLFSVVEHLKTDDTEIEFDETNQKIKLPKSALRLLTEILKSMSEGKPISIVPVATEVTTQKAAEILGCSRPHLVKLLEDGLIAHTKIGKHRRVKFEDIVNYQMNMKELQKQYIVDMMHSDEETGLYDS